MLGLGRGRDWVEGEKGAVGLVGLGWGEVGCGRGAVEYSERRGAAWRSVAQRGRIVASGAMSKVVAMILRLPGDKRSQGGRCTCCVAV